MLSVVVSCVFFLLTTWASINRVSSFMGKSRSLKRQFVLIRLCHFTVAFIHLEVFVL
ncbi:hypothetical protein GGR58DRAFT_479986 [Xylaria digitata]|nr:hypothetical protein GGR58DRAFT_479986 [Xylaria digitata]